MKKFLQFALLLSSILILCKTSNGQLALRTFKEDRTVCPPPKEFNECGTACPLTCENVNNPPRICTLQCVVGCFCTEGLVELEDGCVPPEKCPGYRPPTIYPPRTTSYPTPSTNTPGYPTPSTNTPSYPTPSTNTPGYPTPSTNTPGYPTPSEPYPTPEPPYPYPTDEYPYDPYEPYDPYDPYPFYYCEINEDEYGRPYYGPYDEYRRPYRPTPRYPPTTLPYPPPSPSYPPPPPSYPPPPPPSYPPPTPSYPPPPPPTYLPPTYPPPTYQISPRPYITTAPPLEEYTLNLEQLAKRKKRQVLRLPSCITSNECNQAQEYCTGHGTQYDRCGRRCTCRYGRLVDCCRVRKEWRSMTQIERCRYVRVVHTVSTQQPWKTCYDELIKVHRDEFTMGIHGQTFFLPWHRWFILALENLLRQVDCRITVPYWDWSLESQTWQNSIIWAAQCGLGDNGDPNNNDHVQPGIFGQPNNWLLTPSAGGFLRRRFNGNIPDCASVAMMLRLGIAEFNTWHNIVSSNLHDSVHCNIGGTMCSIDSANAPEFFLHHGYIDKLWADWQNRGPAFKNLPYYSQNNNGMPGAFGYSPADTYDLDNQPGCVRVCIEPPSRPCRLNTTYTPVCPRDIRCNEYSPIKLADMIPRPYPYVPQASYELFRTPYEIQRSSNRFTTLLNNYDELQTVLQNNGYATGGNSYRPPSGELQLDRYIYQPELIYPDTYAPNGTNPDPPRECQPYIQRYRKK